MSTLHFAKTQTLFAYPPDLSGRQHMLFDQLIAWLNDECFENDEWSGEDKYKTFPDGDIHVFQKVKSLCHTQGTSFYWTPMGDGTWKVGIVGSSSLSLEAATAR